jgi:hypothetical protein
MIRRIRIALPWLRFRSFKKPHDPHALTPIGSCGDREWTLTAAAGARQPSRRAIMREMRAAQPRRLIGAAALIAAVALPAPAQAETWVSFPALLAQVRSGDLIRAIINPARHDIEIKFRNLDEWHAHYPPREQPQLQRLLHARGVRTLFVPRHGPAKARPAPVHHHLRYIVAAVLAACAVGAGAVLFVRRRRSAARRLRRA